MRRPVVVLTSFLVAAGALLAAAASAQAPVPAPTTVRIAVGPKSVVATGIDNLPAGPTRIVMEAVGAGGIEALLVSLLPGKTFDDLQKALPRAATDPATLKQVVAFEGGGVPVRGRPYTTTVTLRAGITYLVANVPKNMADTRFAVFTPTAPLTGAQRPTPAATVGLVDYAYAMPNALPRNGVVRFQNPSDHLHMAIAYPVRRGKSRVAAVQALLRDRQKAFAKLVRGKDAVAVLQTVSPGTVNDVEVRFGGAKDWVFVCYVGDGERGDPPHYGLGMVKAFSVR
jgi:hypothetical protein